MKRLRDSLLVASLAAFGAAVALASCNGELSLFERTTPLEGDAGELNEAGSSTSGSASELGGSGAGGVSANSAAGAGSSTTEYQLIDDFEDGDSHAAGNFGWWYRTNDGTGMQGWGFEPVMGREGNALAVRTHGGDFTDWGAILGVTLRGPSAFNATSYKALWFWARAEPQSTASVLAEISDGNGTHGSLAVTLSDTWAQYRVPFSELRSGDGALVTPESFITVQFLFLPGQTFDVWFDDLAFGP